MKTIRLIPDGTTLPFMKWAKIRTPISLVLIVMFKMFYELIVRPDVLLAYVGGH